MQPAMSASAVDATILPVTFASRAALTMRRGMSVAVAEPMTRRAMIAAVRATDPKGIDVPKTGFDGRNAAGARFRLYEGRRVHQRRERQAGGKQMRRTARVAMAGLAATLSIVAETASAQSAQSIGDTAGNSAGPSSSFRISTGINYSRGDYGEASVTEVISVPIGLTYRSGNWKVRVSVPWVQIDGPGSLLQTPEGRDGGGGGSLGERSSNSGRGSANSGSGSSGGSEIEVEDDDIDDDDRIDDDGVAGGNGVLLPNDRRSGFGDINVAMTYSLDLGGDFYLEPTVKVKLPTASRTKRLGTGEVDVTLSADLAKEIGNASFYLHTRRKFAGKPDGSTIRSTWGAGGGASLRVGRGLTLGADYDWQQSAFAGRQASSEVSGWANVRLNSRANLTLFAATGLNANSTDFSGGASISYRF